MNLNGLPESLARYAMTQPVVAQRARHSIELEGPGDVRRLTEPAAAPPGAALRHDETETLRPAALAGATLWELLTADERAFFSDPATLAPLTYRPGGRAAEMPAAPTGQRVDVRA